MTSSPCAFTVDVEDYFQVDAFSSVISPSAWGGFESRVVANTTRLLDLLDRHQVKGTFFVLGWIAARYPDLVRAIAARGHEIASHGMSHQRDRDPDPGGISQRDPGQQAVAGRSGAGSGAGLPGGNLFDHAAVTLGARHSCGGGLRLRLEHLPGAP